MATDFQISDVVNVIISSADRPIQTTDFTSVLLIAPHFYSPYANPSYDLNTLEEVRSLADVSSLGIISGSPVYDMCSNIFGGDFPPKKVLIKRAAPTSNAMVFDVYAANNAVYTINISTRNNSGVLISASISVTSPTSGATATSIAIQMRDAIAANLTINAVVTASASGGQFSIVPNASSSYALGVFPVSVGVVSGNLGWAGVTESSTTSTFYSEAKLQRNDFFFVLSAYRQTSALTNLAAAVEADSKMYICANNNTNVVTSTTVDVASSLKNYPCTKTVYIHNKNAINPQTTYYPDAALVGAWAGTVPGQNITHGKTLKGVLQSSYTNSELSFAKSKNANVYINRGGLGWFEDGKVSSGSYADIVRGSIWLEKTMEEDIFAFMKRKADLNQKIPYTDAGVQMVVSVMEKRLDIAIQNDFISSYKIFPPLVENISTQDKTNRILPDIPFEARLAGAFQNVTIRGTLQV